MALKSFVLFAVCAALVNSAEDDDWQLDSSSQSLAMRVLETMQQLRREIRDLTETLHSANRGLRTERNPKGFLKNLKRNEGLADLQLTGEKVGGIDKGFNTVLRDTIGAEDVTMGAAVWKNISQHLEDVKSAVLQAINPCHSSPCLNGGTCSAVAIVGTCSGTASCTCPENFVGPFCQDFDPCSPSPCLHGGNCSAHGVDAHCDCLDWLSGPRCGNPVCPVLVQQRVDDSPFFDRTWDEFKVGFGDPSGNYWMGNERMHQMTKRFPYKMRFELQSLSNEQWYVRVYGLVIVSNETDDYSLTLVNLGGNSKFSTKDHDRDESTNVNCAEYYVGGYWYITCGSGNINAGREPTTSSFRWGGLPGGSSSLKATRMWLTC